jgi:hypothetical protein
MWDWLLALVLEFSFLLLAPSDIRKTMLHQGLLFLGMAVVA